MYPPVHTASMSELPSTDSRLVLVVSDDPLVVEMVARRLGEDGCNARPLADYSLAKELLERIEPAVVVLDQILEDPASQELLDHLEALGEGAPRVVLLRFAQGPVGPFSTLHVTVVGGERWFEELPAAVGRALR